MASPKTITLLFLLMLTTTASACLQVRGTAKEGVLVEREGRNAADLLQQSLKVNTRKRGEELLARHQNKTTADDRNNYAVGLVYLGRYDEAIRRLKELEKDRPGDYATAANLGTAYELAGKNEDAIKWIQEGLRRNPKSHIGSEWVHVAILNAKLATQKDPAYLEKHGVFNLEPLLRENPAEFMTPEGESKSLEEVRDHITYQLQERLQFVRSQEPVVAELLFELGRLQEVSMTLEVANRIFRMAEDFGYPAAKIQPMINRNRAVIRRAHPGVWSGDIIFTVVYGGILFFAAWFVWYVWRGVVRKPS